MVNSEAIKYILDVFKYMRVPDGFCYNDFDKIKKFLEGIKIDVFNERIYKSNGFDIFDKSGIFDDVKYIIYRKHIRNVCNNGIYVYITGLLDSVIVDYHRSSCIEYNSECYYCYWHLYFSLIKDKIYRTLKVEVNNKTGYGFVISLYNDNLIKVKVEVS